MTSSMTRLYWTYDTYYIQAMLSNKVVVTGGGGFIGSHLANSLVEKGYEVVVIDVATDDMSKRLNSEIRQITGDVRNPSDMHNAFVGVRYVFHCAALPRLKYSFEFPRETNEVNVAGFLNVLLAARDAGVARVINSSSSSVYGSQKTLPLVETMTPKPMSPYAVQKQITELYAEMFTRVYGLQTVSLRYFSVYGPGEYHTDYQYATIIPKFIHLRKEGRPLTINGTGEQSRDFTYVRDIVRANILAAEECDVGNAEAINIGTGKNISVNRIAELVGGRIERVAARLEPHDTLAENSLARRLLNWQPTMDVVDGISELKREFGIQ